MKSALLDAILNCSYDYHDKTFKKVLFQLQILRHKISELNSSFQVDLMRGSAEVFVGHILFSRLPGPLKNEIKFFAHRRRREGGKVQKLIDRQMKNILGWKG